MKILGGTMRRATQILALMLSLVAGDLTPAVAHDGGIAQGPPPSVSSLTVQEPSTPLVQSFKTTVQGDYVAAGVGLRDASAGTITVSLPSGSEIVNAFLYWAVMANSTPSAGITFNDSSVNGTLVGTAPTPCWAETTIYAFRADVTDLATSGANTVNLTSGARREGASLVVVFSDVSSAYRTVIIQDGAVTFFFPPPVPVTFSTFTASGSPPQAKTTWIVADGQHDVGAPNTRLLVDGTEIANHALNGNGPGSQFWDTRTDDISAFVPSGDTSVTVAIESNADPGGVYDCLTWVAQVLSVTTQPPNQAPTANSQSVSTAEDTAKAITLTGSDPEGGELAFNVTTGPAHGTLSGAAPSVTYTPNLNYNGPDSFSFTVTDSGGLTSTAATVSITVTPVDDTPSFTFAGNDANPVVTVTEDSGAVVVTPWVTNTSADAEDQALTLIVTTNNPGLFAVQPAIAPNGTLTFTPGPNATGTAIVTVTLRDAGGKAFTRTFTINVTAENDPPTFEPIANQTVVKPEPVSITGVLAGPPTATDETEDVTVTATVETSSPTNLITNLTVTPATGKDATRILTYERGTQQAGTATIKVTATDAGTPPLSYDRTFTVEMGTGELANAVASSSPPASSAGFSNEPIILTATFTFPPIDWNGDGQFTDPEDCYFVILPSGRRLYNVIPFLEGLEINFIPEAVPTTLGGPDTGRVCTEALTVTTDVRVDDWYDVPEGPTEYTLRYVAFVRDPDIKNGTCTAGADGCFDRIVQGTVETSGVLQKGDQCPNSGPPFGAGAGGTGCDAAVRNTVQIHTVNLGGGASRKVPAVGSQVRVFDRNSADFQKVAGSKNPNGSQYGVIVKAAEANLAVGQVGVCFTTATGQCFAGVSRPGDYLVIVTVVYEVTVIENGTAKNKFVTAYVGRPLSASDFVGGIATKEFQIVKVLKNGIYQETRGGSKVVVTGSILEMIVPESAIWDGTQTIYPFIFTSDSSWTVDVCAQVPAGYRVVGVYDEKANLIPTSGCVQTLVANQEKVVAFEVIETGSPEPSLAATLTVRGPNGKTQVKHVTASDIRRHTFDDRVHEAKAKGTKKKRQNQDHVHTHIH
jgi:hypothetical protein